MTRKYGLNRCLQFGLASFLSCGSVGILTVKTLAQQSNIVPYNTLGSESSQVISNFQGQSIERITGGATRGINLFHSFKEFNISTGRSAYFFNSNAAIENILARVTGGKESEILGKLGTDSSKSVNLFLMNPNGIVFGKDASLDVQGSFVGTTANGLAFGNQGVFSATNPEAPGLLTINPSALFFNQINQNAAIQNNSVASAGTSPVVGFDAAGLRVPDGKSLLLVGGNVSMDGGRLNAFGGRVELSGLASTGNAFLLFDGNNFRLGFPENVARGTVTLTNEAGVFVTGAGGGDIAINARNIKITGGSILSGGIGEGLGTPETVAGDITLNATGEIEVADSGSEIRNLVRSNSKGNGGNITIDAGSFKLRDGAALTASTFGIGNAGNVKVSATDAVSLADNAYIFSTVEAGGNGKGGNIDINAGTLSLTDGAQLATSTLGASDTQPAGRGNAGNVKVNVTGVVDIAGEKNGFSSGIRSIVGTGTEGNGGSITIDAGSLKLSDRAQLSASTFGTGNAGNVKVSATDAVSLSNANIFSTVRAGGNGQGGNIDINAGTLSLTDGAQLATSTLGASDTQPAGRGNAGNVKVNVTGVVDIAGEKNGFTSGIRSFVGTGTEGNGGNINIEAGSLKLRDRAQLSASTLGTGNAGNVKVSATDAVSLSNANIFSTVRAGGNGQGGNIDINAGTLSLTDGAQLATSTLGASDTQPAGRGNAGNVKVNVTGVVDIAGVKNGFTSAIFSRVETGTEGNGGNITIDAGSFKLRDGAQLVASTSGRGNAGNVKVSATDSVSLADNAYIFSTVEAGGNGKGGNVDITAGKLSLTHGARLLTSTRVASDTQSAGRGDAGNVNVKVTGAVDIAGEKNGFTSGIFSQVGTGTEGNGGNITIDADYFKLRDGALLDARTRNNNKGGDITVNANLFEALNGGQLITTTSSNGEAGKITVNAKDKVIISGSDPNYNDRIGNIGANSGLFVSSTGQGITGNIKVDSPRITLDKQGKLNAESASGNGGNITLDSDLLLLRHGSQISTTAGTAASGGNGGNININSQYIIAVANENSDISANAFTGNGGIVQIDSKGIFGIEARQKPTQKSDITASSLQGGISGVININAPDTSTIQNGLLELPAYAIDTNSLIANSCISRGTKRQENSFTITGSGALPNNRPSDVFVSNYTTGEVRTVETTSRPWKKGDPIIEPTGVYQLNNGQLLLSRECSN